MQKDPVTQAVTHMHQHEINLIVLYRTQLAGPDGRTRDDLPYTPEFDNLLAEFNRQIPPQNLNHYEFWWLLKSVLKNGEEHIEDYLSTLGITVPQKP
jgi:hypothetical protein